MRKKDDATLMYTLRETRAAFDAATAAGDRLGASLHQQDLEELLEEIRRRIALLDPETNPGRYDPDA